MPVNLFKAFFIIKEMSVVIVINLSTVRHIDKENNHWPGRVFLVVGHTLDVNLVDFVVREGPGSLLCIEPGPVITTETDQLHAPPACYAQ